MRENYLTYSSNAIPTKLLIDFSYWSASGITLPVVRKNALFPAPGVLAERFRTLSNTHVLSLAHLLMSRLYDHEGV
jgi:hypothetical protein